MMTLTTVLLIGSLVVATDTWSNVVPGIDHLHRVADGQDFHVVKVALQQPNIWLLATGPGENGQRTSAWAASKGATVAINGDLWDANNWNAYEPLGLAMGDGWKWRDDTDIWSFFACDLNKRCWFNPWGNLEANNTRWHNAVGGMQDLLVINGVGQYYAPDYYNQRNPRTGIGLSQDGATLILVVADGRRSGAAGMTFADMTNIMLEFGAYNAINNDGGGSSTLVINGAIQNVPSDGAERVVANHFGIMVSPRTDPACAGRENSRTCVDGHNMRTCSGGLDRGLGDCGYFGLSCETKDLFAYCVDPRCTNGGQNALCLDATRIGMCTDGVYGEGDCGYFGLACVPGNGTATCGTAPVPPVDGVDAGAANDAAGPAASDAAQPAGVDATSPVPPLEGDAAVADAAGTDTVRADAGGFDGSGTEEDGSVADDEDNGQPGFGCACASQGRSSAAGAWSIALVLALLVRRRGHHRGRCAAA